MPLYPSSLQPVGWAPWAFPAHHSPSSSFGSAIALTAVSAGAGGAILVPMVVPGKMLLQAILVRNTNASALRTAEARLYVQGSNSGAAAENTLNFVAGTDAAWSFTPGASSDAAASVSGAPVYLNPGVYWLCLRNTSASQTFSVGSSGLTFKTTHLNFQQAIPALGATLDAVTGWTASDVAVGFALDGRVLGNTAVL
jgi:hypothetical protein